MSFPGASSGPWPLPRARLLLLGLLLLPAVIAFAKAELEGDGELHCVCAKTTSQIHPKHFTSLEVIKAGSHCAATQLIATLKDGRKFCLDPKERLYKRTIRKLLDS